MSYLDVPRFHFSGLFIANPSTVNNTPENFNPKVPITPQNGSWNPNGNHTWKLSGAVRTAMGTDGSVASADPIIGAVVHSVDQPVVAKLVDLDTEQQMVSQIWGMQVKVTVSESEFFIGTFQVVCFNDIFQRVVGGMPDSMFGAFYQSILTNVTWSKTVNSPFLKQLQQASPDTLSIKFNVDGYDDDSTSPTFNQGRVVGTIGPYWEGEPPNFVPGRYLRPFGYNPQAPFSGTPLWFGPARVDGQRNKALIDLGNSIPTISPGGPPLPTLGTLQLAIMTSPAPTILGTYDYSQAAYETQAGVQEFDLTPDQVQTLSNTTLAILQVGTPGSAIEPGTINPILAENANGAYINATQQVYRVSPGNTAEVEVMALAFGVPAANQVIQVQFNNNGLQPAPGLPVGVPPSALQFPASVTTDANGRASFTMTASDPGNPRRFIDGQIYGVGYSWSAEDDPNYPSDPNTFVNVLVFSAYGPIASPTWQDVQPIFAQYAKLYPYMTGIINLGKYTDVQQNLSAIQNVLTLPPTNPAYMQVTRDMSPDKVNMILTWIKQGAPLGAGPKPSPKPSPKPKKRR